MIGRTIEKLDEKSGNFNVSYGYIVFREKTKGWPGSGFRETTETVGARGADVNGGEVQISIDLKKKTEKVERGMDGGIVFTPAQFGEIVAHVLSGLTEAQRKEFFATMNEGGK